jgi:signal transduction histidine kinase
LHKNLKNSENPTHGSGWIYASAWRQLRGYAVVGLMVVFCTALTRLLMRDGPEERKRCEYIETISVECDRQIDFVLNLLDLSRIEGGVLRVTHERVDVQEVISSVVKSETRSWTHCFVCAATGWSGSNQRVR